MSTLCLRPSLGLSSAFMSSSGSFGVTVWPTTLSAGIFSRLFQSIPGTYSTTPTSRVTPLSYSTFLNFSGSTDGSPASSLSARSATGGTRVCPISSNWEGVLKYHDHSPGSESGVFLSVYCSYHLFFSVMTTVVLVTMSLPCLSFFSFSGGVPGTTGWSVGPRAGVMNTFIAGSDSSVTLWSMSSTYSMKFFFATIFR